MLEFALEMSASFAPSTRIQWYVYVGLVSPSASVMPVVTAVSVWPTCAVPVMVGAPAAAVVVVVVLAEPLTAIWNARVLDPTAQPFGAVLLSSSYGASMAHPAAAPASNPLDSSVRFQPGPPELAR